MLDDLARFIKEHYDDHGGQDRSGVYRPGSALMRADDEKAQKAQKAVEEADKQRKKKLGAMDATERLVDRLKVAHSDAEPTAEDLQSVDVIDEVLQWQEYMVRLWEDGFRNALSYGDLSDNDSYRGL